MANVVIAGGSDETRLLLRGLVRLHHHRVVSEGRGPETLSALPEAVESPVLLLDAEFDDPAWAPALEKFRGRFGEPRVILLTPDRTASFEARARAAGVQYLLHRPFAVHDLVEALGQAPVP